MTDHEATFVESTVPQPILVGLLTVEDCARRAVRGTAGDGAIRMLGDALRDLDRVRRETQEAIRNAD